MFKNYLIAKRTYQTFSNREGNEHIASEFNLYSILRYINFFGVKSVFEVGAGIGTITEMLMNNSSKNLHYVATEKNEFCLHQLKINAFNGSEELQKGNFKIVSEIEDSGNEVFDFLIIDGVTNLDLVVKKLNKSKSFIFIEGTRSEQVDEVKNKLSENGFPHKTAAYQSVHRNRKGGPFPTNRLRFGHTLFYINPSAKENSMMRYMSAREYYRAFLKKIGLLKKYKRI